MLDDIVAAFTANRGSFTADDIRLAVAAGILACQPGADTEGLARSAGAWVNDIRTRYPEVSHALTGTAPARMGAN